MSPQGLNRGDGEVTLVERRCSCCEIAGEDPNCILHGHGTMWAKENPDLCAFSERYAELEQALNPFAEALDEWGDDPRTADWSNVWEHPLGMCITVGDFRKARAALSLVRRGK